MEFSTELIREYVRVIFVALFFAHYFVIFLISLIYSGLFGGEFSLAPFTDYYNGVQDHSKLAEFELRVY